MGWSILYNNCFMIKFLLKINYFLYYLYYVILPFVPIVIHELSHWVIAVILYPFDINNKFPIIVIDSKASIVVNEENDSYDINLWGMSVEVTCNKWEGKLITVAPLFTFLLLGYFAFTNGILTSIIFIYNSPYLFLSRSDIMDLISNNGQN